MALESTIEKHFCKRVEEVGGIAPKTTVLGRRGFFDRMAILPGGKVWFVELKRPKGGIVSEHQKEWHDAVRSRGGAVHLLYTKEQIDALFAAEFNI